MTTTQDIITALNAAETLDDLWAALALVSVDLDKLQAAADRLRGCAQTEERVQAYLLDLVGAGVPAEAVESYDHAMCRWHALSRETPEQRAIREAFAEARHLRDTLGDDHPKTHAAVIHAIELQDPGCCARMASECGITLPEPDYRGDDGQPLYSTQAIAKAFDVPHEQVIADAERLMDDGLSVHTGPMHRLQ